MTDKTAPVVKIHNTLSGKKEPFVPLDGKTARIYVCGITPYDSVHLGHARCYVVFDVIKRYLRRAGFEVRHVQNFTDVDDKIIKRASENGAAPGDVARKYIGEYFAEIRKLGVLDADVYPLVTETMPEIISMVAAIIKRGYGYEAGGDVYFSVRKFKDYGKLSGRSPDELLSGARVAPDEKKSDPLDFALWKKSKPGEPSWDSPWGKGRPGWHIECSAMASKYLGDTIDIHGGGHDLIFPHHENEIAQSESASGKPFARYFVHNGFVTVNAEKMSKSLGNFFALSDIFKKYEPRVARYFLVSVHYRSPLDFSDDGLNQAAAAVERIQNALCDARILAQNMPGAGGVDENSAKLASSVVDKFDAAMSDDFNTAEALAQVHALANYIFILNRDRPSGLNKATVLSVIKALSEMLDVLGLDVPAPEAIPPDVIKLAEAREEARRGKNYRLSDELRDKIKSRGYAVEDTKDGAKIRKL